jgi:hypothetical protein
VDDRDYLMQTDYLPPKTVETDPAEESGDAPDKA